MYSLARHGGYSNFWAVAISKAISYKMTSNSTECELHKDYWGLISSLELSLRDNGECAPAAITSGLTLFFQTHQEINNLLNLNL